MFSVFHRVLSPPSPLLPVEAEAEAEAEVEAA